MKEGVPLEVYLLSFGVFVIMLGFAFLMPFFPLFARDLGATPLDIGLLVSIFMLTRAILAPVFGRMSDKSGHRKNILLLGSIMYAVLMIAFALSQNILELYIIRALQGVASAAYWPIAESLIADLTTMKYRGRAMGIYMTSNNMAFFLGPGAAGIIFMIFNKYYGFSELLSYRFSFIIAGLIAFISTIIILVGVKEPSVEKKREIEQANAKYIKKIGYRDIHEMYDVNKALLSFYVMALANGFAMGMSMPIFVLYMSDFLKFQPEYVGFVLSAAGFSNIVSSYPAGWLSDKFGRRGVIIIGMFFSRLASIILPFTKDQVYFAGTVVTRSFFFNVASPSFRALQADIVSFESRGKVFGLVQAFFNIGAIFGPAIGTYIYQLYYNKIFQVNLAMVKLWMYGPAINFIISGFIGLFSLAIFIVFVKPLKKKNE